MQKSTKTIKTIYSDKSLYCKNLLYFAFILFPLASFTFYSSSIVIGQETQENYAYKDILICQVMEYLDSPIGSDTQQVSNICSYQNSIGYNQSITELCFIFSGKSIDIIHAFCEKALPDQMPTSPAPAPAPAPAVNETSTSPAPAVNETSTSPAPAVNETSTSPAPAVNETSTSPAPAVNETSTSPAPAVNETSTSPAPAPAVNEPNNTLDNQNNIDDGSRLTIFEGVSNFFSNMFNP
ncbi:MAG: hypothetical protein AB7U98_03720 [Candidatus Nitrosocosmicus sp.]